MNCIACGKSIPESAVFCNFCGAAQSVVVRPVAVPPPFPARPASPPPRSAGRVALIVVLAIIGFLIVLAVVVVLGAYAWLRFNSVSTVTNDKALEQVLVAPPPPPPPPPPQSAAEKTNGGQSVPASERPGSSNSRNAHPAVPHEVELSAGVSQGLLIQKTIPIYPPIAKAARVQGTVVLAVTISKTGEVTSVHVVSGPAMLQQSAIDAVKTWRYSPYQLNGEPVEVQTTVNVIFTLGG